ncbi:phosphate ABC transporter substrate-binding protein [Bacillus sp. EAC]|uniref:phosphate ABC transporter substrate-binding protein n=1 Tax=Bacillus sp. EAC TaxID=1978338 RepID=UPI000B445401|nr:phosphate ABC transporter substrate-binding protein [Bacillus sp. EAC]
MKLTTKKLSIAVLSTALAFGVSTSYTKEHAGAAIDKNRIVIAGSTALLPLTNQASKEFKKSNPKIKISVSGSSSIAGPQAVTKGSATIGACDWDATTEKVTGLSTFSSLEAHKIAVIPFAAVVSKNNPVDNLSTSDLTDIYTGKIKNWKEVGGPDHTINVYTRSVGSGTRVNFEKKALKGEDIKDSGSNVSKAASSGAMKTSVAGDNYGIGYIDLAYITPSSGLKALKYNGVAATVANVKAKKYPVWGYGYLITKKNVSDANMKFIKFMQSSKFQNKSLKSLKFIPVKEMK